ncbi:MAG TPA: class I tRNA ligase family protein, partial [Candidatus Paceibacterota bacterium]
TDDGKRMVAHAAEDLKKANIDLIIVSPIIRTQETAAILARELAVPDTAVMVDERLREGGSGQPQEVRQRIGEFIFEVERRYTGKNILIISHGYPLWMLHNIAARKTSDLYQKSALPKTAAVRELSFASFPHNANYELDLHRPYIDDVKLVEGGRVFERIPEVIDCWVESGSMPFASMGYPKDMSRVNPRRLFGLAPKGYPGDFIAEYIAQTRTWFYYMHAMGVLLFNSRAFKAVVSTGTILAADGSKMSKSKGNYTDPYELMDKWGADALRLHLMGSVVMQSEDLNFRDEDIREAHNRTIGILWNSYKFFELYKSEYTGTPTSASTHVLDRWIQSRLNVAVAEVTAAFDAYDTPRGVRALRSLVDEYSTWYLRRSRDRVKAEGDDKQYALANQREALLTIAKLLAPVTPYIAEAIYRGVMGEGSVHLTEWPAGGSVDQQLVTQMTEVRDLASVGLKLREKAGIKVRQPLASMTVTTELTPELTAVLMDELNVKKIKIGSEVALDTNLTQELREEGMVRDLARKIQDWRKAQNLTISDRPTMELEVTDE